MVHGLLHAASKPKPPPPRGRPRPAPPLSQSRTTSNDDVSTICAPPPSEIGTPETPRSPTRRREVGEIQAPEWGFRETVSKLLFRSADGLLVAWFCMQSMNKSQILCQRLPVIGKASLWIQDEALRTELDLLQHQITDRLGSLDSLDSCSGVTVVTSLPHKSMLLSFCRLRSSAKIQHTVPMICHKGRCCR